MKFLRLHRNTTGSFCFTGLNEFKADFLHQTDHKHKELIHLHRNVTFGIDTHHILLDEGQEGGLYLFCESFKPITRFM